MAKDLAREIGYIYIDSGAMYRAVTLYSMENGIFTAEGIDTEKLKKQINSIRISFQLNPETGRPDTYLNGINVEKKIRTMEVSSRVSPIAALDFVREAMVAQQQEMGKAKGIVMDGRDIGTTVFPDAELKIFVTASPEIRAQRRYDELKAKGEEAGSTNPGECEAEGLYRPEQGSESAPQSRRRTAARQQPHDHFPTKGMAGRTVRKSVQIITQKAAIWQKWK